MSTQRRIERHQLPYYLKVFNQYNDKPLGYIGNLSLDGLMLISQLKMLVGGRFDLRIKMPGVDASEHWLDFTAVCQWCHEDVTPGSYDCGFSLEAAPAEYAEMIQTLQRYFSFRPLAASV